jgi:hypothetical protein
MIRGTCALCRNNADLRESHLLAAAFYKRMHDPEFPLPDPILVTTEIAMSTSKQIKDYLLCGDCETLFSRRGEDWVLKNCHLGDGVFPLRSARLGTEPVGRLTNGITYSAIAAGVDADPLVYFGASVFWRNVGSSLEDTADPSINRAWSL